MGVDTSKIRGAKIAIVGGGPAGLSAALAAGKAGLKCSLFEREMIGERIQCAEGLFDPAEIVPIEKEYIKTKIIVARLIVAGRVFCFKLSPQSHFYVIDRFKWQKDLGGKVRDLGVEVYEGAKVLPEKLMSKYSIVIDARGATAFYPGLRSDGTMGFGVQWTLEGDFSDRKDSIEIEIHEKLPGYYWIFPKGGTIANIGFGCLQNNQKGPFFWSELEGYIRRQGFSDYKRVRKTGGFLAAGQQNTINGNIIRVGDAGGFASPLHGGGIDAAWLSGRLAVEAFLKGDYKFFIDGLNKKLGILRNIETKLMRRWLSDGPSALMRAADVLDDYGPVMGASVKFFTTGRLGNILRRSLGVLYSDSFYILNE